VLITIIPNILKISFLHLVAYRWDFSVKYFYIYLDLLAESIS
jgi:hypothetical protein